MSAHSVSEIGKIVSADTTLEDGIFWAEELQKHEFRGLGDTREAARYRVAVSTGVPESYLSRLRHKTREMKDLPASIYVRLAVAYSEICLSTERKAENIREKRSSLKARNEVDKSDRGARRRVGLAHF